MTHAQAVGPLLLPVVRLSLGPQALTILLGRPPPRRPQRGLGACRRTVRIPTVAGTTDKKLLAAFRTDPTSQLLHGRHPAPAKKLDEVTPAVSSTASGPTNWTSSHAAWSANSAPHPFSGRATRLRPPPREGQQTYPPLGRLPTVPRDPRARRDREPALCDDRFQLGRGSRVPIGLALLCERVACAWKVSERVSRGRTVPLHALDA